MRRTDRYRVGSTAKPVGEARDQAIAAAREEALDRC
jgi:hypothetical protein